MKSIDKVKAWKEVTKFAKDNRGLKQRIFQEWSVHANGAAQRCSGGVIRKLKGYGNIWV